MFDLCKEIIVFLVFAKVLEGFFAENKYGKFIKLIVSLIVVLKLMNPIFSFFDAEFDLAAKLNGIEYELWPEHKENVTEKVGDVEITKVEVKVEDIWWEK